MERTKKIVSRLIALGLTLVMVLSLTTLRAFAAGTAVTSAEASGSVTIQGSANDNGASVNLYKIIDVNVASVGENQVQPTDPVYIWNSNVAQWVKTNYSTYINTTDNGVNSAFNTASASNKSSFYAAMARAIGAGNITMSPAHTTTIANGTATVHDVVMGQYLVVATKSGNTYNPATVTLAPEWSENAWQLNDATVTLKSKGDIQKVADKTNVNIGDTVTYTVTTAIPAYPADAVEGATKFNVGDTMGTGLTWSGSVSVYWSTDGTTYTGNTVGAENYTLATTEIDGATFEVQFKYDDLIKAYPTAKYVHLVYTATINENAFTVINGKNTAYVGVNTNPYDEDSYEKTTVDEQVYTYGITVTKVDADNTQTPLAGAEFKLYSDSTCNTEVKFEGSNGVYTHKTNGTATLTTASNGQIQLKGLAHGTYYLKEVKAPGGYQLPSDANAVTTVVLNDANSEDGDLDNSSSATGTMVTGTASASGNVLSFQLKNEKPSFTLPTTGGMGTVAFTTGGLLIMACGAALLLFAFKKRKNEN